MVDGEGGEVVSVAAAVGVIGSDLKKHTRKNEIKINKYQNKKIKCVTVKSDPW